jgi:hypothetical protein
MPKDDNSAKRQKDMKAAKSGAVAASSGSKWMKEQADRVTKSNKAVKESGATYLNKKK